MLPLGGGPRNRSAGPGRVVDVLSLGHGGRIGLLLRFGLACHDLDVSYVDDLPVVLTKRDVLNNSKNVSNCYRMNF